jgi:hypothetical protein
LFSSAHRIAQGQLAFKEARLTWIQTKSDLSPPCTTLSLVAPPIRCVGAWWSSAAARAIHLAGCIRGPPMRLALLFFCRLSVLVVVRTLPFLWLRLPWFGTPTLFQQEAVTCGPGRKHRRSRWFLWSCIRPLLTIPLTLSPVFDRLGLTQRLAPRGVSLDINLMRNAFQVPPHMLTQP